MSYYYLRIIGLKKNKRIPEKSRHLWIELTVQYSINDIIAAINELNTDSEWVNYSTPEKISRIKKYMEE